MTIAIILFWLFQFVPRLLESEFILFEFDLREWFELNIAG